MHYLAGVGLSDMTPPLHSHSALLHHGQHSRSPSLTVEDLIPGDLDHEFKLVMMKHIDYSLQFDQVSLS